MNQGEKDLRKELGVSSMSSRDSIKVFVRVPPDLLFEAVNQHKI